MEQETATLTEKNKQLTETIKKLNQAADEQENRNTELLVTAEDQSKQLEQLKEQLKDYESIKRQLRTFTIANQKTFLTLVEYRDAVKGIKDSMI